MRTAALLLLLAAAVGAGLLSQTDVRLRERLFGWAAPRAPLSLAVLGDSDSHSYQDRLSYRNEPGARGGVFHKTTLQWTEVIDRLRADQIDSGEWAVWGTRRVIAQAQNALGLSPGRLPRKEDFRFNLAMSGAVCGDLMNGLHRQAPPLVALMDQEPGRWRNGVVVIRLGGNPLARAVTLDKFARDPAAPEPTATLNMCVEDIRQAVALIKSRHAEVNIVLVGIFDNSHWAKYFNRWRSKVELANISSALDRYDEGMRAIAASFPRAAFFDDRAWFEARWGSRGPDGLPAYREVVIGKGFRVSNALGDHPSNACIADGHSGTVWNALWSQSLLVFLNTKFDLGLRPLTDAELVSVIDPEGSLGIR